MAMLLCLLVLVGLEVEVHGSMSWTPPPNQCERIEMPDCQELGYNWTVMPNLMGNADQKEADEAMAAYEPLLSSQCSPHTRFFLCSAFAPLCSEHVSGAVGGCRGLCQRVVSNCEREISSLPPSAKALLDCARFPDLADRRLCMRPPNTSEATPTPPPQLWPFSDELDIPIDVLRDSSCPPAFVRGSSGECVPACGRDALYRSEDKARVNAWTTTVAWISLLSTAFAVLTFCADPSRFRYPERPVVFLAACHAAVALAQLARGWLGAKVISCAGVALAVDGLESAPCAAFFSITYYFTLAADAWFLNACVAWYLTAASEWSTEALERASAYFHAAAWGWAGAWTAAALALRRVSADELTGTCGVADSAAAALIGVPRGALLGVAVVLGAGAWPGVRRVRRVLDVRGARRVGRLAARSGAAGALYCCVAAAGAVARVWESRRREIRAGMALLAALQCPGGTGCEPQGEGSAVAAVLWLCAGAAAGAWAWSHKSVCVWRRAVCPPRKTPVCCRAPAPLLPPTHLMSPYCKSPTVSRV